MKKRSILAAGLTLSMLLSAVSGLTACHEKSHSHSLDAVAKKDATCTEAGYEAYYKCSGCDKLFSDEKGENEITAPTAIAAGHKIEAVAKQDATCTTVGAAAHYKCTGCNTLFSDAEGKTTITAAATIPVTAHTIVEVPKKRPTCTEEGYEEHYKCSTCNTLFSDEEGTTVIAAATAIPAEHRISAVPKKEATCVEAGYEAYFSCSVCHKLYSDKEATAEIAEPVAIPVSSEHTLGFAYTADTVPAPVADGGELSSCCTVCGQDMGTISYDAGLTMTKPTAKTGAKMGGAGTYYFQLCSDQHMNSYFGFHATKAGTYTIAITHVYGDAALVRFLEKLWILKSGYPSGNYDYLMYACSWDKADVSEFSEITAEDVAKYKEKVDIAGFVDGQRGIPITTVTFTFTEEDVAGKGLYIMLGLNEKVDDGTTAMAEPTTAGSYLIKFEEPEEQA